MHTADWHLGQTFFGYDRVEEHAHFLDWLARELKENEIDVLLIAGDVFDVSNPSAVSQRMFYRFIRRVTTENPQLQLVIVAGNHDSAARLEAPLPLLQEMRTDIKGIVRRRDGEIDYDDLIVELKNRSGEVEALCLAVPFLRQGDYPVVVTDGNPYAEGVKELYTRLQNRAMERRKKDQAIVAVGHLQATGSEIANVISANEPLLEVWNVSHPTLLQSRLLIRLWGIFINPSVCRDGRTYVMPVVRCRCRLQKGIIIMA